MTKNPVPTNEGKYLRTADVARLLHVSPKTISRWAKEGKLPFVRTLGGHRRYPEQAIMEIVQDLADNEDIEAVLG